MRRIFLDANVLFSAVISPEGRSSVLFALAGRALCTLLTSSHAATEVRRNVEARYPNALERFDQLLGLVAVVPEAGPTTLEWARTQSLPDQDAPILAAAAAARVDMLVTGDRTHFGHLFGRSLGGLRVLRLVDVLRELLA